MADKYGTYSDLAKNETADKDFLVRVRERQGTAVVIAPHGGGIEPGTSEIAEGIAGDDLSFYAFEGTKPTGNGELHITSTRFDEPRCIALVTASPNVISIHGEDSERQVVFLGGRDDSLLKRLRASLEENGFTVETHPNPALQGCDTSNICNRGKSGYGVQLEISSGLRSSFFESLRRTGRQKKTERFHQFVTAVRAAIL